ncbi:MAG: hypothetical protein MJ231_04155 [bacterium]|nr:hypothetical protein [bacterium]
MVDNRSAGFYGIGGSFNFKSGDASGTAAKMSQEKYGSEAMYLPPLEEEEGENFFNQPYVDRSALLRATLNSLAMNNVASVLNSRKHKKKLSELSTEEDEDETIETLEEVFVEEDEDKKEENKETDIDK